MRLRALVGAARPLELAGPLVAVAVPLRRPGDAIGPVQAGVEPLRAVRRDHLRGQHRHQLVVEHPRGALVGEVTVLPARVGPAAREAVEQLAAVGLADVALAGRELGQLEGVGLAAPQPLRDVLLGHPPQPRRHAGLAEVLLRHDVDRHLRPALRHLDVGGLEDRRAIGVGDARTASLKVDAGIGATLGLGEQPRQLHGYGLRNEGGRWEQVGAHTRTGNRPRRPFHPSAVEESAGGAQIVEVISARGQADQERRANEKRKPKRPAGPGASSLAHGDDPTSGRRATYRPQDVGVVQVCEARARGLDRLAGRGQ